MVLRLVRNTWAICAAEEPADPSEEKISSLPFIIVHNKTDQRGTHIKLASIGLGKNSPIYAFSSMFRSLYVVPFEINPCDTI